MRVKILIFTLEGRTDEQGTGKDKGMEKQLNNRRMKEKIRLNGDWLHPLPATIPRRGKWRKPGREILHIVQGSVMIPFPSPQPAFCDFIRASLCWKTVFLWLHLYFPKSPAVFNYTWKSGFCKILFFHKDIVFLSFFVFLTKIHYSKQGTLRILTPRSEIITGTSVIEWHRSARFHMPVDKNEVAASAEGKLDKSVFCRPLKIWSALLCAKAPVLESFAAESKPVMDSRIWNALKLMEQYQESGHMDNQEICRRIGMSFSNYQRLFKKELKMLKRNETIWPVHPFNLFPSHIVHDQKNLKKNKKTSWFSSRASPYYQHIMKTFN